MGAVVLMLLLQLSPSSLYCDWNSLSSDTQAYCIYMQAHSRAGSPTRHSPYTHTQFYIYSAAPVLQHQQLPLTPLQMILSKANTATHATLQS